MNAACRTRGIWGLYVLTSYLSQRCGRKTPRTKVLQWMGTGWFWKTSWEDEESCLLYEKNWRHGALLWDEPVKSLWLRGQRADKYAWCCGFLLYTPSVGRKSLWALLQQHKEASQSRVLVFTGYFNYLDICNTENVESIDTNFLTQVTDD